MELIYLLFSCPQLCAHNCVWHLNCVRQCGSQLKHKTILQTCDNWDTDYNSYNWEPDFMTIFDPWQSRVTVDSIRNSCDVLWNFSFKPWGGRPSITVHLLNWLTQLFFMKDPHTKCKTANVPQFQRVRCILVLIIFSRIEAISLELNHYTFLFGKFTTRWLGKILGFISTFLD